MTAQEWILFGGVVVILLVALGGLSESPGYESQASKQRRLEGVHIAYVLAIVDWFSIVFVLDARRGLVALGVPGGVAWVLAPLALAAVVIASVAAFAGEGPLARIGLPLAFLALLGGYTALVVVGRG